MTIMDRIKKAIDEGKKKKADKKVEAAVKLLGTLQTQRSELDKDFVVRAKRLKTSAERIVYNMTVAGKDWADEGIAGNLKEVKEFIGWITSETGALNKTEKQREVLDKKIKDVIKSAGL